jgi:hypothetical protein
MIECPAKPIGEVSGFGSHRDGSLSGGGDELTQGQVDGRHILGQPQAFQSRAGEDDTIVGAVHLSTKGLSFDLSEAVEPLVRVRGLLLLVALLEALVLGLESRGQ